MGYQVLARKYRPQRFADVAGQEHVTHTLLNALQHNRIAHGYIFSGHRGIGKTTIARILAQALNCRTEVGQAMRPTPEPCGECDSCREIRLGSAVDVIEIDAATNRGIDEIRELREAARYSPARDRYKIYILDEAHQITDAAFNALLKTLEEPPAHVVFMMATTEPEHIPLTIRSRCQHFSFHAVRFDDIVVQLSAIAEHEQVQAEPEALALLAEAGDGSMRDALSIMDQAMASAPIDNGRAGLAAAQIRQLMGSVPNAVFERLLEEVSAGRSAELMEQLNGLLNAGHSPASLARQLVRYLRNALMAKLGGEQTKLLEISADERARATRTALLFSEEELTRNLQIMLRTFDDLNYRQEQRFHLELGLLKLIHAQRLLPIEQLLSSLGGPAAPRTASRARPPAKSPSTAAAPSADRTQPVLPSIEPPATARAGSGSELEPKVTAAPQEAVEIGPAIPALEAAAPHESNGVDPISAQAGGEQAISASADSQLSPTSARHFESTGVNDLRQGVVSVLVAAGHSSAAQLLGAGAWTIDGSTLRIETRMGKKMIGLYVNTAAEKLIRQELARLGGPTHFLVLPGQSGSSTLPAAAAPAAAGSIEETALAHPLVQRAREIFKAEVRSVLDLRQK
jgi:DNA polymerase III subunit gamma/tau